MFTTSLLRHRLLAPAALALCAATTQAASVIDYSDLTRWTSTGDVLAGPVGGRLTTASAIYEDDAGQGAGALNLTGSEPAAAFGDIETFLGVPVGSLDADVLNQATEGSAIKLTLNVVAGDFLTIDWSLLTNDVSNGSVGGMDYLFLTVGDTVHRLGQSGDAAASASSGYLYQTSPQQSTFTFLADGAYTIGIGLVDVTDYANTTQASITHVALTTAVPEPQTWALAAGSAVVLVAASLRRRTRAA